MELAKLCLTAIVLISIGACRTDTCEEEAPTLEYERFDYFQTTQADTLVMVYSFVDCQGDIGLDKNAEGYNLISRMYEYIDGEWIRFFPADSADTVLFFSKIPISNKVNVGARLEGTVEQRFGSIRQNADTIRFETQILDRANNRSNVVVTEPIRLQ